MLKGSISEAPPLSPTTGQSLYQHVQPSELEVAAFFY